METTNKTEGKTSMVSDQVTETQVSPYFKTNEELNYRVGEF